MVKKSKRFSKIMAAFLAVVVAGSALPISFVNADDAADGNELSIETQQLSFTDLSAEEIVEQMGAGYNLGNTFDGHTNFTPNETVWQPTVTSQTYVDALHDMGFNTIRIPVTWGTMINDEDYSIKESWISRVQDVVDYAISQDMFVILNIHHDGAETSGWLNVSLDDMDPVYEKYEGVWKTISTRFKDYDEHLIFESMNEITDGKYSGEPECYVKINKLNQIFVDTVRATGSNNAKRWLLVPGKYTNIESTTNPDNNFTIPTDSVENRIMVSVHYYSMGLGLSSNLDVTEFNHAGARSLLSMFERLRTSFTSKGIPVVLGEYGTINKNNDSARAYHHETVTAICAKDMIVPCFWDNGAYEPDRDPDYNFTLVNRENGEKYYPTIISAMIRGTFQYKDCADASEAVDAIPEDQKVVKAEDIVSESYDVSLKVNESKNIDFSVTPEDSNDTIVWKTSDRTVATVYNGKINAKAIGTAVITATSDSGSVSKEYTVTVTADESIKAATSIKAAADELTLATDEYFYLNAAAEGGDDSQVTYKSSNTDIATVSTLGKVVAKSNGTAYIVIQASTGLTKTVKVTVGNAQKGGMRLALNIYQIGNYYGNEYGAPVEINGEGQYTVEFDITKDLSDEAKNSGIEDFHSVGAIYIKDYDVSEQNTQESPITECDIKYDEIYVNGEKLTVTQTEPDPAMKGTTFDSGKPINAWDGSYVSEVEKNSANLCEFKTIEKPTKISVTFTLSNMKTAGEEETTEAVEAENIEVVGDYAKNIPVGETSNYTFKITPAEAGNITVVSSDESIAYVDSQTKSENGQIEVTIKGLKDGVATITAYADNGKSTSIEIAAGNAKVGDSAKTNKISKPMVIGITGGALLLVAVIIIVSVVRKKKK